LTGQLNRHPKAAMELLSGKDRLDIVRFFDSLVEDEG
jgi:hypothetical protein